MADNINELFGIPEKNAPPDSLELARRNGAHAEVTYPSTGRKITVAVHNPDTQFGEPEYVGFSLTRNNRGSPSRDKLSSGEWKKNIGELHVFGKEPANNKGSYRYGPGEADILISTSGLLNKVVHVVRKDPSPSDKVNGTPTSEPNSQKIHQVAGILARQNVEVDQAVSEAVQPHHVEIRLAHTVNKLSNQITGDSSTNTEVQPTFVCPSAQTLATFLHEYADSLAEEMSQ